VLFIVFLVEKVLNQHFVKLLNTICMPIKCLDREICVNGVMLF